MPSNSATLRRVHDWLIATRTNACHFSAIPHNSRKRANSTKMRFHYVLGSHSCSMLMLTYLGPGASFTSKEHPIYSRIERRLPTHAILMFRQTLVDINWPYALVAAALGTGLLYSCVFLCLYRLPSCIHVIMWFLHEAT